MSPPRGTVTSPPPTPPSPPRSPAIMSPPRGTLTSQPPADQDHLQLCHHFVEQ